jgi:hypothetical protein
MPIEPNRLYPRQMNGPVISANGVALNDEFSDAETIESYLYNLSIDTANDTELDNIGLLIGYPRPVVPEGFNAENILLLGTLPLQSDSQIGLSEVGSEVGGELSTLVPDEANYMNTGTYRKFLKSIAVLKRYGVTLKSVDLIAKNISQNYELKFTADGDISIDYQEDIGFKNIWILTQLFYRIATEPQVLITSVGE